jgi:dihydrodipicolinate synthase/N-acetylneuraminate lyase
MASIAQLQTTVKGLVIPIPAVFDGKGEPDLPMMEKLTDWYLDAGVHGFFILGSQGQHNERIAPIRSYGRRITLEGLHLRGLAIKEYPRWPTQPLTAEHYKLYEDSMKRVLEELSALTPKNKHKLAV